MQKNGRKSITFRLTLLFASTSTVVLLLLGYLISSAVEMHFEELDMEVLSGKLELTQHALKKARSKAEIDALPKQLEDAMVGHHGLTITIVTQQGQTLFASSQAEFPPALFLPLNVQASAMHPTTWKTKANHALRGISALAPIGNDSASPAIVAVATDMAQHEHFMRSFEMTLWSVVILAAVLSGFLGWVSVRRGLAPLQAIKREAEAITAHHLHSRLNADMVPVELADLTHTLNQMLARLENSFRRLADFSSNIAHELRTPVSIVLTQTQVTLSKARTDDEYRDILASNAEEFERLSRIIADMLFLAKADNDLIVPHRESINLAAEVTELLGFYEALAEEKNISLSHSGTGIVMGDRPMLRRAVSNLLSNAIRHTPMGGRVTVNLSAISGVAVNLSVENTGETIPSEYLPRLFERFYRADSSRARFVEGAGLGLAITLSIMHAHRGDVLVTSESGITTFTLKIPA